MCRRWSDCRMLLALKWFREAEAASSNLASNAAFQPLPRMVTDAAAKAFVLHFSEALKIELKGRGIQVMAVCPGATATSFRGCNNQDEGRRVRQRRAPLGFLVCCRSAN